MNSNTSRKKSGRKVVHLRCRKISSTSNKSQLSHSHIAISAGHKRRIASLLKNNKTLANALQESRQELSDVKNLLEAKNENSSKMMIVQSKMLHMHSTLESFMKDFDEILQLLYQDDTCWPTLGYITKSRKDFKNRMQNAIDPIEETSERESFTIDPKAKNCHLGKKSSSNMFTNTAIASNSKKVFEVLQTEVDKGTRKEFDNLTTINEDAANSDQENSRPAACDKLENLNDLVYGDHVLKTPVFQALSCKETSGTAQPNDGEKKNIDDILPARKMEISSTPELFLPCPFTKASTLTTPEISSVPSCTSQPVNAKNSKIPRFQDLPAVVKKMTSLHNITSKKEPSHTKNLTKKPGNTILESKSDFHKKDPVSENSEIFSESSDPNFNNKCSNIEEILTETNLDVSDIREFQHRKTFVVKKSENDVNVEKSQSDRRKTFVKKICKTDRKSICNKSKRKTFIVSNKDSVDESIDNNKNHMIVNTSAPDNIIQNQNAAHSLSDNTVLSVAPVLDSIMTVCGTEKLNNNLQSTEMLIHENQIPAPNHLQESQLRDEHIIKTPVINCEVPSVFSNKKNVKECENSIQNTKEPVDVCILSTQNSLQKSQLNVPLPEMSCSKDTIVTHSEIRCNDFPDNVNAVIDQNIIQESDISRKEEKERKLGESVELNLQECCAGNNEHSIREFNQDKDTLLEIPKINGKPLAIEQQQKSLYNLKLSSDSEDEVFNTNFDFDFDKDIPVVKDPPIRRRISKSKPQKVFVFDLNKKKASLSKNKQNKLKSIENSLKNHEDDILTQSNNDIESNIEMQNIQDDPVNVKVQIQKKKKHSVRFSKDVDINENHISNTKSKTCRNNSSKQKDLSKETNGKKKTVDKRENEKLAASEIEAKVPSCEAVISTNCQTSILLNDINQSVQDQTKEIKESNENVATSEIANTSPLCRAAHISANCKVNTFSNDTDKSIHSQNDCVIDCNSIKNKVAVVEIHRSDVENIKEKKPKKSKTQKRKSPSDLVPSDDCLALKKSKLITLKEVDKDANSQEITSDSIKEKGNLNSKYTKKETKSKGKNIQKKIKKNNEDISSKNTILVQAEIHPPPSFVNMSLLDFSPKENIEADETKSKRLSVVLSDVFQSKDILNLNLSCHKEFLLSKEKTNFSSKVPLSENSTNIQNTAVTKNVTKTAQDSQYDEEINNGRRRRVQKFSYKELPLNKKLRR